MKYLSILLYAILPMAIIGLSACEEDHFDPGGTEVEALAGEWYVETSLENDIVLGYQLIATYNTAANSENVLWVDDYENIWPFKVRANADLNNLSFSGNTLENMYTDTTTVSILEGRIIPDAATTSGGNRADSIFLRLEFSDEPGNVYQLGGYRRTGFLEDEH